ncbi:MAG: hypothetical protein ACI3YZ_08750 [Prevotella sp.]
MKQLNRVENIIFLLGAIMIVVGSAANLFFQYWAPYVFAMGVVAYVLMQLRQSYEGTNVTIRRLRRIVIVSDVFFIVSAVLMFASIDNIFGLDHITYIQYVHNKWVATVLIAAVLQLYSSHRLGKELSEETKKS